MASSVNPVFTCAICPLARSLNPPPRPRRRRNPPRVSISTNPSHVDPLQLRALLAAANYSCHRFPALSPQGRVELADPDKLRLAIAHSYLVLSAFFPAKFLNVDDGCGLRDEAFPFSLEDLFGRAVPGSKQDLQLVGFGRAVSDGGLTASIHDVVVNPSLQRQGIGQKIVTRMTRILASRGIHDISVLCSENERLFFKKCSFGEDSLGSTTMMYARSSSDNSNSNRLMQSEGSRLQLLVPPGLRAMYCQCKN